MYVGALTLVRRHGSNLLEVARDQLWSVLLDVLFLLVLRKC